MSEVVTAGGKHPFFVNAINFTGRQFAKVGISPFTLDENKLLSKAQQQTGLSDFGDDSFREGLQVLLASLKNDAQLNTIGQLMAQNSILRLLTNRLLIEESYKRHPEISEQDIDQPLIIAGLPRTGTTILQHLLSADPRHRFMTFTEGSLPVPPFEGEDKRQSQVAREMDMLCKMVPGFRAIHDMGADLPQECVVIMALNFCSVQFELNFNVPCYREWYFKQDLEPTLQYHKRVLKLLQFFNPQDAGKYWVLKTPPYVSAIEPLLKVYPDAQIIQTHRDPAKLIASVSSLYFALLHLTSDYTTAKQTGAQQLANWSEHLNRNLAARQRLQVPDTQIADVYFQALLDAPVAAVKDVYQQFNLPWSAELENTMHSFMANNQRNKHGVHHYTTEMYGLDKKEMNQQFKNYCDYFQLQQDGV